MLDHANPIVSLALPYKMEFLNVVVAFVAEIGQSLGASEKEKGQLRLAAEEVFNYIMEALPATENAEVFYLRGEEDGDAVKFTFSYHSTPINVRATPEFTVSDIETTLEGLGLSLAKQVTDSFECINCGSDGWLIVFAKRLGEFQSVLYSKAESETADVDTKQEGGLHITRAVSRHVPQLMDLVYRTYRYSYAKNYFYDEAGLQKAIEEEKLVALVAEDEEDKAVGCIIAFFDSPQLAEIGGAMIDPGHRSGPGIMLLARQCKRLIGEEAFKNTLFYSKTVTSHTYSQQLNKLYKFAPLGLRLSVYEHARFVGIATEQEYRESLLFGILTSNMKGRELQLYVPPEHQRMVTELFANTGIAAEISAEELPDAACVYTNITRTGNEKKKVMEIQVNEIGSDFAAVLKKETFAIQQDGYVTCLLAIPADKALPAEIGKVLKENKYFFSGLHISTENRWFLLYTNLYHQRFQFANVKLYDLIAQELLRYIEKEYLAMYQ